MKTYYKRIPFDLEKAKRITNGEMKGKIVAENGNPSRIICFDYKALASPYKTDVIEGVIALVRTNFKNEVPITYTSDGICFQAHDRDEYNLHLEIPTYYRDYTNFKPQKWQLCLVRDSKFEQWSIKVCCGKDAYGVARFYGVRDSIVTWLHMLPLSKVTERLIGTTKSYEEIIQELDNE